MRTTFGWTRTRPLALALGALALMVGGTQAAAINGNDKDKDKDKVKVNANLSYDTSGPTTAVIEPKGITGTNVISFVSVQNNSVQTPSSLSLGTFVVAPLPDGETTVYDRTPFAFSFAPNAINGDKLKDNGDLLTVTGFFNGSVTGKDQSNVVATFDPISKPDIALVGNDGKNYIASLDLPSNQRTLVPSTTFLGQSTVEGTIILESVPVPSPAPVPEPTTIALFLAAGAGIGLRRRFQAHA
jgi:hypothetical protein